MSADLSRFRGRPPPPSWKPPPLPDEVDFTDVRRRTLSPRRTATPSPTPPSNVTSTSTLSPTPPTSVTSKPSSTLTVPRPAYESATPSTPTSTSPPKSTNATMSVTLKTNDVAQKSADSSRPKDDQVTSNVPKPANEAKKLTKYIPPKVGDGLEKKMTPKSTTNVTPNVTASVATKPDISSKSEQSVPATFSRPEANGNPVSKLSVEKKLKVEPELQTGLKLPAKKLEPTPSLPSSSSSTAAAVEEAKEVRPLTRFGPKIDDTDSKPKWNPRQSVKSKVGKSPVPGFEAQNGSQDKNVGVQKLVDQKTVRNVEAPKIEEKKKVEFGQKKLEANPSRGENKPETDGRNSKPATIDELSSAIRFRLKDKSGLDPLSGLTRLDQCLLLASSTCSIRSVRFEELNIKCLVKAYCSSQEETGEQEDIETINVVLNPDKVWDPQQLDLHFDKVADAVDRVGKAGGVVLIQSTSDNKGGTRPRKLRLNLKAASSDGADCDSLAGALCVAFFVKHRRLPLESALELIKQRRQDMKPSSALTLQLMEYEKKVRGGSTSTRSKFALWRRFVASASQNWIPLTIYFLVVVIIVKCLYEALAWTEDDDDGELVCK